MNMVGTIEVHAVGVGGGDVPGRVIAEVEDEEAWLGGFEGEVSWCGGGWCVRGCGGFGVGGEPVGWVGVGEGVVVGADGGVFVGCVAAEIGVEERETGGDGVFGIAVLVEDCVGGVG